MTLVHPSTALGRLSTRFRNVFMGALLLGHTLMLDVKARLSVSTLIHPKGVLSG